MEITETQFIMNTFFLLFCGSLVMFMAAGFAMLEAGMVRSKSVAVILLKNISLYAISGVMFFIVGYNLMYDGVDGGLFGSLSLFTPDDTKAMAGDYSDGHASTVDWFFQMVFVATAASIVSGTLAERIKLWPFFIFCAVLTGFIYPITGSWVWGEGFLSELGFYDFAGSTLVHSVGGWAALSGAILLGARRNRFDADGKSTPIHGSSLPLVTIGTFILWFGWFGFNGGSQLSIATAEDAIAVGKIFANTNLAAAAGALVVMAYYAVRKEKADVTLVLNGALAGLVSITAEPLAPSLGLACCIGIAGGLLMIGAVRVLEALKVDDVVGAIPVHLAGGIWGTLAVTLSNPDTSFMTQLFGIACIGAFVTVTSTALWSIMKITVGIRLHWSEEDKGGDIAELGIRAYNFDFAMDETVAEPT